MGITPRAAAGTAPRASARRGGDSVGGGGWFPARRGRGARPAQACRSGRAGTPPPGLSRSPAVHLGTVGQKVAVAATHHSGRPRLVHPLLCIARGPDSKPARRRAGVLVQGAPRGFRPPDGARAPSAARDDARTPSAARPGESGPLILQSTTVEPSTSLWEQVFPATTWASVLGGRTVTVTVEGGRATLLGARDGQRTELGRITAGRRAVSLAELEQDWLWVEPDGGGVDSVTWSIEADLALPPVTVVVPTYRREQDTVAQVRRFTQIGVEIGRAHV